MKPLFRLLACLSVVLALSGPFISTGQTTTEPYSPPDLPINTGLPIPNEVPISGPNGQGPAGIIANFYSFAFLVAGFLAFIMIVYGGVRYTFSAGNHSWKEEGKEAIRQALFGLGLLLVAYLILRTINPDLTQLKLPTLAPYNPPVPVPVDPDLPPGTAFEPCSNSVHNGFCTAADEFCLPDASNNYACRKAPTGTCTSTAPACSDINLNTCVPNSAADCAESGVNKWSSQIQAAAASNQIGSGINTVAMLKAIMSQESSGRNNLDASDGLSYGAFQIRPSTANSFKSGCTTANITASWLKDDANVQAQACIAINVIRSLISSCGTDPKNLAAGYNGGGAGKGACNLSLSCHSCSLCGNEPVRRWQCPWDGPDGQHLVCNVDRGGSSFNATRRYAPKVLFCYHKYGG